MQRDEFLRKLEQLLEMDNGSLSGEESLEDLENWDSLAHMGFIALVHREFKARFSAKQIVECKTPNDLIKMLGDHIE